MRGKEHIRREERVRVSKGLGYTPTIKNTPSPSSTCAGANTQSPTRSSAVRPHPDLVPELLSLLSQLLQLTHGAGPVGRGWGRLGAAGRGLGAAAPRRWPEAWGMQGRRQARGHGEGEGKGRAKTAGRS